MSNVASSQKDINLDIKIVYSGTDPLYVGRAKPETLTSEAKWQIYKVEVDVSGNITSIRWADGNDKFDKEWDEKTGYDYGDI